MQSVHTVQEERSGQPAPRPPAARAEEEPSAPHPADVLPAVPVLLQVQPEREYCDTVNIRLLVLEHEAYVCILCLISSYLFCFNL